MSTLKALPKDAQSIWLDCRRRDLLEERSRQEHIFADRILSAMRFQFGGHVETKAGSD